MIVKQQGSIDRGSGDSADFSTVLLLDGSHRMAGNLDTNYNKIVKLTDDSDVVNKNILTQSRFFHSIIYIFLQPKR